MAKSNLSQSVRTMLSEKIRAEKGEEARKANIRAHYGKKNGIARYVERKKAAFVQAKKDAWLADKIQANYAAKAAKAAVAA